MDMEAIARLAQLAAVRTYGSEKQANAFVRGMTFGMRGAPRAMPGAVPHTPSMLGRAAGKLGYGAGAAATLAGGAGVAGGGLAAAGAAMNPDHAARYVDSTSQYNRMRKDYESQIEAFKKDPNAGQARWWNPMNLGTTIFGDRAGGQEARKQQQLKQMQANLQTGNYGGWGRLPDWMGGGKITPDAAGRFGFDPTAAALKQHANEAAGVIRNKGYNVGGLASRWKSEGEFNQHLDAMLKANPGMVNPRTGTPFSGEGVIGGGGDGDNRWAFGGFEGGRPGGPLSYDSSRDGRSVDWSMFRQGS